MSDLDVPARARRRTGGNEAQLVGSPRRPLQAARGPVDHEYAHRAFLDLLALPELDARIQADPGCSRYVESALGFALENAYAGKSAQDMHLFLQRALYAVNRLKLFWYDDLERYDNERSSYLRSIRDRIEGRWQSWESRQHDPEALRSLDVEAALRARCAADLDPPLSATGRFFSEEAGEAAYRTLVAIASVDGLVEASQLSRTLGGVSNEVHAKLTRLLLEEYGYGKLARKHSSYFVAMLAELGMDATPEAHLDVLPWEVLAVINHSFLLSERKRYFLRYIGGLLYTEVSVPSAFRSYRACAERLHLSESGMAYWDLHIKEDERHGRWMLNDIALPLARRYPAQAWELVLGYDQQRLFSARAGAAVAAAARAADGAAARGARVCRGTGI